MTDSKGFKIQDKSHLCQYHCMYQSLKYLCRKVKQFTIRQIKDM